MKLQENKVGWCYEGFDLKYTDNAMYEKFRGIKEDGKIITKQGTIVKTRYNILPSWINTLS